MKGETCLTDLLDFSEEATYAVDKVTDGCTVHRFPDGS